MFECQVSARCMYILKISYVKVWKPCNICKTSKLILTPNTKSNSAIFYLAAENCEHSAKLFWNDRIAENSTQVLLIWCSE